MSTYIRFRDGEQAHILDRCVGTITCHIYIETKQVYEREKTAIKRALILHRKKLYNSTRARRRRVKITHIRREIPHYIPPIPTIVTHFEGKKRWHLVIETGKRFKRIENAILNAIEYVKSRQ